LVLSVAKYYSPNGKTIQDNAITPNITVADANDDLGGADDDADTDSTTPDTKKDKQPKTDEQLRRAIEVLKNKDQKVG
jgi:carboxyl-terminal processing protease